MQETAGTGELGARGEASPTKTACEREKDEIYENDEGYLPAS